MNSSIRLANGNEYDPWTDDFGLVDIRSIARGLANEIRFAGQGRFKYTVAQHCVLAKRHVWDWGGLSAMADNKPGKMPLVLNQLYLGALLHDASEAVLKDIPGPFKKRLRSYRAIQNKLDRDIFRAHNISHLLNSPEIKRIDKELLDAERAILFPGYTYRGPIRVEPWDAKYAYHEFIRTYKELVDRINVKGTGI